jgi:tetratricopeptide (TPR) repeat protein
MRHAWRAANLKLLQEINVIKSKKMKSNIAIFFFIKVVLLSNLLFGHTSAPVKIKCPIDGEKFTIMVTMSYTTFNTMKDFQKQGAIGDLYESMINSCPKCHYCGYKSDFDTTFNKPTKEEILHILEPFKDIKLNDVLENEIAAKIHLYFKDKNDAIANIYLVASYFLKYDSTQTAKRKELQEECINYLIKAIDNKEYEKKETYATINYLIGELYRRIDNFQNAIKYFDLALNDENKKDWLQEVTKKQKEMAVAKDDKNDI